MKGRSKAGPDVGVTFRRPDLGTPGPAKGPAG